MEFFEKFFFEEAGFIVEDKVISNAFQKLLYENCDESGKKIFDEKNIYDKLIEKGIIQKGSSYMFVYSTSDHFVKNKYDDLLKLLNHYKFSEHTKKRILTFYEKETGVIQNIVNTVRPIGGSRTYNKIKTIKKRKVTKKRKYNKTK
jgi:hypothetical protein